MKVRQGWSGEIEPNRWGKFDLELEEEDLRRLLADAHLPADTPVPLALAFQLLENEAEFLVLAKLVTRYGYPNETGRERMAQLTTAKGKLLDKLRGAG